MRFGDQAKGAKCKAEGQRSEAKGKTRKLPVGGEN